MHYFNITMRNVVKALYKDTIPKSGSGSSVGGSGMLDEEEIMKLLEKEEMAKLELQVAEGLGYHYPIDSPLLRVHSLGSDEGSMTLHELTVLYTTLSKKVESLESDLKQTKLTYGAAYTKLIIKVKKWRNFLKSSKARRRVRLIVSKDKDDLEDPSKQGRKIAQLDKDEGITLFTAPEEVYTAEPDISTANVPVSTAGAEVCLPNPEKKTKLQLEQERLVYEEALRLQEQLDEDERLMGCTEFMMKLTFSLLRNG
ncbi:hypothetical protein Tco_0411492 [Tanacetum coccineum]